MLTRTSSSTTESMPPDKPSTTWAWDCSLGRSCSATAAVSSAQFGFPEFSITHQAFEALFDQFIRRLVVERAQRVLQGLLERLPHRRRVAMGTAYRFADDPVDQSQRLKTDRRDAKR